MRSHPSYQTNLDFFQDHPISYPHIGLNKRQIIDICAQILCLMSSDRHVEKLLLPLEKKLQTNWLAIANENNLDASAFPFIKERREWHAIGLTWRVPKHSLAPNEKFYGLLNNTLHAIEMQAGINLPLANDKERSPIPTFIGIVDNQTANKIVEQGHVFREKTIFAGSFFHGTDIHRLHLAILLEARNTGFLDLYGISSLHLLQLLIHTNVNGKTLWYRFLDNHDGLTLHDESSYTPKYKITIKNCTVPFYFNNFIINNVELFPYLSSCVTKQFWSSLNKLNHFQKLMGYYLEPQLDGRTIGHLIQPTDDWTLEKAFHNMAACFCYGHDVAVLEVEDALLNYLKKGKIKQHETDAASIEKYKNQLIDIKDNDEKSIGTLPRALHCGISLFKLKKSHRTTHSQSVSHPNTADNIIYEKKLSSSNVV